jgi:ribosomal protein L44E
MAGVLDATTPKRPLRCDECGRSDRGERGWRAYLTREPREVALFCPACAAREFGGVHTDPGRAD